ncbi:MAG: hypothetical protein AAB038_03750 [Planctomycetota bacterium]
MIKENDLALISAAVYAYLQSIEHRADSPAFGGINSEEIVENGKEVSLRSMLGVYTERSERALRSTRKRSKWKQAFFPQVNEKWMRCNQWSR